jgi:PAS domain S-box-containing protein
MRVSIDDDATGTRGPGDVDHRKILEELPGFVWTAKPNGALDFVNQRCCDYFRRSFDQMIEWGWADVVHPDDLAETGERWSLALESGEPVCIVFRLRRASDGVYVRHLSRGRGRRDASGRIVGWYGFVLELPA